MDDGVNYNANNDVITVADADNLSFPSLPFSVSTWIKFDTITNAMFVQKQGGGTYEWDLYHSNASGNIIFRLFSNGTIGNRLEATGVPASSFVIGTWYNIQAICDGTDTVEGQKVLINGVDVTDSTNEVGTFVAMTNTGSDLLFGKLNSSTSFSFKGTQDETYIFNKALTAEESLEVYNEGLAGRSLVGENGTFHHLYFIGESNSGGYALNTSATASELDSNNEVQIWNNITNTYFWDLDISINNNLEHNGLDNSTHGWELQLQTKVADVGRPIYLTKCGQGGSTIDEWDEEDTYYTTFVSRSNASKSALTGLNLRTFVMISFGINDAIAGTDTGTWYTDTYDWIERIRAQTGAEMILITKLMTNTAAKIAINTEIDNLVTNLDYLEAIDVTGATLRDSNHWDYAGMKLIMDNAWDIINP